MYIAKSCWLLSFECSVHVSDGFTKTKKIGWGWVGGVSSIQFYFGIFLNFAKSLILSLLRNCTLPTHVGNGMCLWKCNPSPVCF